MNENKIQIDRYKERKKKRIMTNKRAKINKAKDQKIRREQQQNKGE